MSRPIRALALALALATAGCSKVETGTGPPSGAAKPGVVRIVGIGSVDSLLPELSGNQGPVDVGQFWAAWLYHVNDRGELEPELATDVPTYANGGVSRDGLTITYHLRKGVAWQDGAPFSARDVTFSWHAIMNPRNNILTRTGYDQIAAMDAPDPYTLKVRLKRPYAPAVASFFGPSLAPMCILPAHLLEGLADINRAPYDRKPIGTGPFAIERYEPGIRIVLKANPHYWRGPPRLAEIDVLIVPDPTTRLVMMHAGEADLYYDPPDYQLAALHGIAGVHVNDATFNEFWFLRFNESHAPLDDPRVRRAVAMGVDREYIIQKLLAGNAAPAASDQPFYSWAYRADVPATRYDPVAAADLLDAAGWRKGPSGYRYRNGQRLSFTYVTSNGYGDARRFGPVFQQEMARIGVDVGVKLVPTSLFYAAKSEGGLLDNGKFDVAWEGWIGGVDPDDATLWTCDQIPPNGYNHSFGCDPRIDALEAAALASYDRRARREAYWKIQDLLYQDVPVVFLYWNKRNDAVRNGFLDYRPAPTVSEFWNSWQWSI